MTPVQDSLCGTPNPTLVMKISFLMLVKGVYYLEVALYKTTVIPIIIMQEGYSMWSAKLLKRLNHIVF